MDNKNEPPEKKPPFDIIRATFYLVAFVFASYSAVIFVVLFICAWQAAHSCIREGGLGEALSTLLASALAFAAGRSAPPKE